MYTTCDCTPVRAIDPCDRGCRPGEMQQVHKTRPGSCNIHQEMSPADDEALMKIGLGERNGDEENVDEETETQYIYYCHEAE